jgi:hypothetical protein
MVFNDSRGQLSCVEKAAPLLVWLARVIQKGSVDFDRRLARFAEARPNLAEQVFRLCSLADDAF